MVDLMSERTKSISLVPGLRDNHFNRVHRGRLYITRTDIEAIFKPITEVC